MLFSEFPQALGINLWYRTIVCNTFEVRHTSGDLLNANEKFEDKDEYGFTGLFFKKSPFIIDDNAKIKMMNMKITPKANIDEKKFNNPISKNSDKTKEFPGGIEVLKLGKMSSHIDIENFNK